MEGNGALQKRDHAQAFEHQTMSFRDELRFKYPKTFAARDRGAPLAAIKLQCLECVGGSKPDVRDCTDKGCPLYTVRPYKTDAELAGKTVKPRTPAQLAAAQKAGERLAAINSARKTRKGL